MRIQIFIMLVLFCAVGQSYAQSECAEGEWLIDGDCTLATDSLGEGWHTIVPGGETRCAHDTDYQFLGTSGQ